MVSFGPRPGAWRSPLPASPFPHHSLDTRRASCTNLSRHKPSILSARRWQWCLLMIVMLMSQHQHEGTTAPSAVIAHQMILSSTKAISPSTLNPILCPPVDVLAGTALAGTASPAWRAATASLPRATPPSTATSAMSPPATALAYPPGCGAPGRALRIRTPPTRRRGACRGWTASPALTTWARATKQRLRARLRA
jgi:hypothetical protein